MTWYKLSPWRARLGASALSACLLTLAACDATEVFEPQTDAPLEAADAADPGAELVAFDDTLLAAASRRGIPIGTFAQPMSAFGRIPHFRSRPAVGRLTLMTPACARAAKSVDSARESVQMPAVRP